MTKLLVTTFAVASVVGVILLVVVLSALGVWLLLWPVERAALAAGRLKVFLASRFLRSHMIVVWSIAGVVIGIMVMTVVTSVMSGFSEDIRDRIRGMNAHLTVRPMFPDQSIERPYELAEEIRRLPNVTAAAPRMEYLSLLLVSSYKVPVTVLGIDPECERGASDLERYFRQGDKLEFAFDYDGGIVPETAFGRLDRFDYEKIRRGLGKRLHPGVVLGAELLRLPLGTIVTLTTVRPGGGMAPRFRTFEVVGHFRSGMAEYDSQMAVVSLGDAQEMLGLDGRVNEIAVELGDFEGDVAPTVRRLEGLLAERSAGSGPMAVRTWREEKQTLLAAVEIEKTLQWIIIACIVVVAGFNILAFYTILVRGKTRDIGVLRALGMRPGGVAGVFLASGMLCGFFGAVLGAAMGLALAYNLNFIAFLLEKWFEIEVFPKDVYYLDKIPVVVDLRATLGMVAFTVFVGLVASVYPALRAARQNPIESIRHE